MTAVDQLELTVDTSTHASIMESSTSNYLDNVRSVHFIASLKLFGDPETLTKVCPMVTTVNGAKIRLEHKREEINPSGRIKVKNMGKKFSLSSYVRCSMIVH